MIMDRSLFRLIGTGIVAGFLAAGQVVLIEMDLAVSDAFEASALLGNLSWACMALGAFFAAEWIALASRRRPVARGAVFASAGAWLIFQFLHTMSKFPDLITGRPRFGIAVCFVVAAGAFAFLLALWRVLVLDPSTHR